MFIYQKTPNIDNDNIHFGSKQICELRKKYVSIPHVTTLQGGITSHPAGARHAKRATYQHQQAIHYYRRESHIKKHVRESYIRRRRHLMSVFIICKSLNIYICMYSTLSLEDFQCLLNNYLSNTSLDQKGIPGTKSILLK